MSKPRLAGFLLAACALALPQAALAFRCGTRLVVEGDGAHEVRARCGEPADVRVSQVLRPPVIWVGGHPVRVAHAAIAVEVETWTYNLGARRLMQRLRFEDGILVRIDTLGYGYP